MTRGLRYAFGRIGQYGGVLLVAITLNFALPRALPGSPLRALGGEEVELLPAAERARLISAYELDRPLVVQLGNYLRGLATGDFGRSFVDGRPVRAVLLEALPWTLLLVGTAILIATAVGLALGALAGLLRERRGDAALLGSVLFLDAIPPFWLGMLLTAVFAVWIPWLPLFGATTPGGPGGLADGAAHLVLPVTTLVVAGLGQVFLTVRSAMVSVLGSEYLEHARARGLSLRRIVFRHALRNAALPVHTVVLMELGWLVGGSLVVETLFAYPGLGRLTFDAVAARDFPVMQGAFVLLSLTMVAMNALADATYPLLDPRLRARK